MIAFLDRFGVVVMSLSKVSWDTNANFVVPSISEDVEQLCHSKSMETLTLTSSMHQVGSDLQPYDTI